MSQYARQSRPAYPSEQPFGGGGLQYRGGGMPFDSQAGKRHAQLSLVFGVLALFFGVFFVIFAPLAIVQAGKAEGLGEPANAGRILGWVAIGYWVIWFILMAIIYSFMLSQFALMMSDLEMLMGTVPPEYGPPV